MPTDYSNDPEFQELIQYYLDYLLESLPTLNDNWNNRNYRDIQQFAHNLKGNGGVYGFYDLSELGKKMELAAKDQDDSAIEKLIKRFEELLNEKRADHYS